MEFSNSTQFGIVEVYRRYCDIKLGNAYSFKERGNMLQDELEKARFAREAMVQLSKMVALSMNMGMSLLDELQKLLLHPKLTVNNSEFTNFYDFVFFMCRENGQKNITVSRAIAAWRLVLAGRFRLLNQWCDFVEKNQRYNISEDTWRQVLSFSRCVHEDLQGYDSEGAWPSLIDDFVEHMYRITGSNDCSSQGFTCNCGDPEDEYLIMDAPRSGLKKFPGAKRKLNEDSQQIGLNMYSSYSDAINPIINLKRRKQQQSQLLICGDDQQVNVLRHHSPLQSSKSPCAAEGCLSKGFSGLLSSRPCVQNQE